MSYTQGPWYVATKQDCDEEGHCSESVYDREGGVFTVIDREPETIATPWLEADARLIAAAPDMLEVLEWLDIKFDRFDDGYGRAMFSRGDFKKVRAAIKKARAEE